MRENNNDVDYLYTEMLFERPATNSEVIIECPKPMTKDQCNQFWLAEMDSLPGFMLMGIR